MRRKYSFLLTFVVGVVSGCALIISIGMIRLHKDKGALLLAGPKVYGDVFVIPSKVDKNILPDVSEAIYIKDKEGNLIVCLHFDDDRNVSGLSLTINQEYIMGAYRSRLGNDWEHLSYGTLENENYVDINCDGSFDFFCMPEGSQMLKSIYIDNRWINITEGNYDKATLKTEQGTKTYLFSDEKGWREESQN